MPSTAGVPRRAVVFGHADGDGYLATEVTRENLAAEGWIVSDTIVDPQKTKNYKFWQKHFQEWDFSYVDLVVSVDIAFDMKDPAISCEALSHHAARFPNTRFIVIDHHPLPAKDWLPDNLILQETSSVYDCCYGESNDLMVIASICDNDETPVKGLISEAHRVFAKGVNRAAADTAGVAGRQLLAMLENKEWAWFYTLGQEPSEFHRTYYGRRTQRSKPSMALKNAMQRAV